MSELHDFDSIHISFRQFKEETTPLPIVSLATRYIGRLTRIWNGGGDEKNPYNNELVLPREGG